MRTSTHFGWAVVIGCLVCTGCGEDWHVATYPAEGKITINGAPPKGAVLELHATGEPADVRNSRPWAVVEEDGTYTLSTYSPGDGAPAGEYAVAIRWPPDVTQPSLVDRLNNAYASPQRSQWHVTISAGENELAPIEISDAKVLSESQVERLGMTRPAPPMGR